VFLCFANGSKRSAFPVVREIVISKLSALSRHWFYVCCAKVYVLYVQIGTNRLLFSWRNVSCKQPCWQEWLCLELTYTSYHLDYIMSRFLFVIFLAHLFFFGGKRMCLLNCNGICASISVSTSQETVDSFSRNTLWKFCQWNPPKNVRFNFLHSVLMSYLRELLRWRDTFLPLSM
jgi:hypothetical protein